MSAIAFDTHACVKRLTSAGMLVSQAEVIAEGQTNLIESQLATKADLESVEGALRADLKKTTAALKLDVKKSELRHVAKIDATNSEILKWMFGQTIVILGVGSRSESARALRG